MKGPTGASKSGSSVKKKGYGFATQVAVFGLPILLIQLLVSAVLLQRNSASRDRIDQDEISFLESRLSPFTNQSRVSAPSWLVMRAARSAILQAEARLGVDLDLVVGGDWQKSIDVKHSRCDDSACSIEMSLHLALAGSAKGSIPAARPLSLPEESDQHVCRLKVPHEDTLRVTLRQGSFAHVVIPSLISCHSVSMTSGMRSLVVVILRGVSDLEDAASTWMTEAAATLPWFPFEMLVIADPEAWNSVKQAVATALGKRKDAQTTGSHSWSGCVELRPTGSHEGGGNSDLGTCNLETSSKEGGSKGLDEKFPLRLWLAAPRGSAKQRPGEPDCAPLEGAEHAERVAREMETAEKEGGGPATPARSLRFVCALTAVEGLVGGHKGGGHKPWKRHGGHRGKEQHRNPAEGHGDPGGYGFVVLLEEAGVLCEGGLRELLQALHALRRSPSRLRCGAGLRCQAVLARDVAFWRRTLTEEQFSVAADRLFAQAGRSLTPQGRAHFRDRRMVVARRSTVRAGLGCEAVMTHAAMPAAVEEEVFQVGGRSGCLAEVDALSPCWDPGLVVDSLRMPRWFRGDGGSGNLSRIGVQIIARNRPAQLHRTVSALLPQTRPECITIHVDGHPAPHSRAFSTSPQGDPERHAVIRVVEWFSRAYGVRWRVSAGGLHPAMVRRLGFAENIADIRKPILNRTYLSATDRLVAMTYGALAFAFEEPQPPACSSEAAAVLEDDLVPMADLASFFDAALAAMEADETLQVASAWNDNAYSVRPGLRCAVQRGSYFMSLGWMTTRRVWDYVVSDPLLWPKGGNEAGEKALSIANGWEMPFLAVFGHHELRASGIFPTLCRVRHQPATGNGWSVTSAIQNQILEPLHTFEGGRVDCSFETDYAGAVRAALLQGRWIDLGATHCYRELLGEEAPATFVLAMNRTGHGLASVFDNMMRPWGWVKGVMGVVRGFYRDTVVLHVAHHDILVIGPDAPALRTDAVRRLYNAALASRSATLAAFTAPATSSPEAEALKRFFSDSCLPSTPRSRAVSIMRFTPAQSEGGKDRKDPRASLPFVAPLVGARGQNCDQVCTEAGRVCARWAAIYAYAAAFLQDTGAGIGGNRTHRVSGEGGADPAAGTLQVPRRQVELQMTSYGVKAMAEERGDLPVWDSDGGELVLGLARVFTCGAPTASQRVCPCCAAHFDAAAGDSPLFPDAGVGPPSSPTIK